MNVIPKGSAVDKALAFAIVVGTILLAAMLLGVVDVDVLLRIVSTVKQ